MGFYNTDWNLRYAQTREGELYRENEKLQQELEDNRRRQGLEDYNREQDAYRVEERRHAEREELLENQEYHHNLLRAREEDIEHLKLCRKFGIQEGET